MTARRGRRWCYVCRLPASQKTPLWDGPWRDDRTDKVVLLAVHGGACAEALSTTHTYQQPGGTMPKTERPPTPAEEAAEEADAQEAQRAAEQAEPESLSAMAMRAALAAAEPLRGELVDTRPVDIPAVTSEQVMRYVRYREPLPEFDSDDVARAIALELLDAPTLADAMRPSEMMEAKDLLWQNIVVHGVKWQPSDLKENPKAFPVYAVMDVTVSTTGERALVTCGGLNVVAIMVKADLAGEWPVRLRLTTTGTRSGFDTYKVEPWTEPVPGEEPF